VDDIRWPGLVRKLRGQVVGDFWYDPSMGAFVIAFEGGPVVAVSADWETCQIVRLRLDSPSDFDNTR
jgi:hypothetical protein